MTKPVLLFGKHGMLAQAIQYIFHSNNMPLTVLGRPEFDIKTSDFNSIKLDGYAYVINACGLTNRWETSISPNEFKTVNSDFPHRLAALCERNGTNLIHISTDCVFSGKGAPYNEHSTCDGQGLYAQSKILGEPKDNSLVIRTSIIGPEIKNQYSLLSWVLSQQGQKIQGYTNHFWNGVTTYHLAELIIAYINHGEPINGIRHIHSPSSVSKAQLIQLLVSSAGMHDTSIILTEDKTDRDMRLATTHPEFLSTLPIHPLAKQINDMFRIIQCAEKK